MSSVAQVINPLREHRRRTQPRIARGLFGIDTDARLEPDAVLVDETDASHRHPEEIRCHLRNAVKSRFRRRVENLVSPESVQALRFVLWEHGVHRINSPPAIGQAPTALAISFGSAGRDARCSASFRALRAGA